MKFDLDLFADIGSHLLMQKRRFGLNWSEIEPNGKFISFPFLFAVSRHHFVGLLIHFVSDFK